MADSEKKQSDLQIQELLKPFHQRASLAEDRLSRIEAALSIKKGAGSDELIRTMSELQSKLEDAKAGQLLEQEKAQKLATENAKLQYRIIHLVRALEEADHKLQVMITEAIR